MRELKYCTFNLRYENPFDGKNGFVFRQPLIKETLIKERFDVIGFQEVLPGMRGALERDLPMYAFVGCGRESDFSGESNPIAYRKDSLVLQSCDTFWLSNTPDVSGSRFTEDQSICPRICTCAVFVTKDENRRFRVYNTHLDHVGEKARESGMRVILGRIQSDDAKYPDVPVVLGGDFNATPDSPFPGNIPLRDVTANVPFSYHEYQPDKVRQKIDYIYTNAACDAEQTRPLTTVRDGIYLSDHYPLAVTIRI